MDQEIAQAIIPHIPTIVGCVVALVVSVISCAVVLVSKRRETVKKEFERKYGEPLKITPSELVGTALDGVKIIAPKGKKVLDITDCEFVKAKEDNLHG